MKIDKSVGIWSKNSTEIDDIAYQLYLLENKVVFYDKKRHFILKGQLKFVYDHSESNLYDEHFKEALIILRKRKLDNINNINNI